MAKYYKKRKKTIRIHPILSEIQNLRNKTSYNYTKWLNSIHYQKLYPRLMMNIVAMFYLCFKFIFCELQILRSVQILLLCTEVCMH